MLDGHLLDVLNMQSLGELCTARVFSLRDDQSVQGDRTAKRCLYYGLLPGQICDCVVALFAHYFSRDGE